VKPIHVLLVDDNPADIDLTREALESSKLHIDLDVVMDGVEAMDFLKRRGSFAEGARPDLILLDLNLPRKDGRQVLAEIKEDEALRGIPVVILTSSDADVDIAVSYQLGANCYVTKPVNLSAFQNIVHALEGFWFTVVKLPAGTQSLR